MKKNITKLGAMALVGIMGMGLAAGPVSAAPATKATDVFYTTSSAAVDADGKIVMVVPAAVNLTKETPKQDFNVTMQTSDPDGFLPQDFKAEVEVKSENQGKLKLNGTGKAYAYEFMSLDQKINFDNAEYKAFHSYSVSNGATHAVERRASVDATKSVSAMENEDPGTMFKDTLTFKVKTFSGAGLKPNP